MGVTLGSIRQLNTLDSVRLQGADDAKTVQSATKLEKAGAIFHTDVSKARNVDVVNTLKTLVNAEPRYMGIRENVKGLIENIKIEKPIQLRNFANSFDTMSMDKEINQVSRRIQEFFHASRIAYK